MAEFASKGVGGAGLGLGIAGTALGLMSGGLGNILGGVGGRLTDLTSVADTAMCLGDHYLTKSEAELYRQIAAKDSELSLVKSEQNTEIKIADVYERIMTKLNAEVREQRDWNANQSVINAQLTNAITTNTNSIAGLNATVGAITRTAVPQSAICNFGCGGCGNNV